MKNLALLAIVSIAAQSAAWVPLTEGHIDLGLGYDAGNWDPHLHVHDGDLEYGTDEAYLSYGTTSRANRPSGAGWDFIGVGSGQQIWRNYTNNVAGIPWAGFGFEEIATGTFGSFVQTDPRRDPILGEWIDLELVGYTSSNGGHISFFQGGGSAPTVWFATSDGIDSTDRFISTTGGHEHGSFAFTATGVYSITLRASAIDLTSGNRIYSDNYTYWFGVEQPVPEPATLIAVATGLVALARRRRN